jgi:hypothetical protein
MAAGLGFKTFNTGDVLTAADTNGYLMQGVWVFANAAARTSAVTSPQEGNVSFLKDTNSLEIYDGAAWVAYGSGDITEVQAGTGISVASGTGPVPVVTNTVATAYDAKGDLIVGTGADTFAKLTVGTNGHTLVADSSTSTGLKWEAVSSTPSFVGCVVHKTWGTAGQSLSNTTQTVIDFNGEIIDTDGFHDNSTNNSRITIPTGKGGKYFLYARGAFDGNANGSRAVTIRKNGSDLLAEVHTWNAGGTYGASCDVSAIASLNAGDYIEMRLFQSSGGSLNTQGGDFDAYYNTLQVQFLGA